MMHYRITVILSPQPEGGYTVTCEELPGLVTEGDSVEEALENVEDAFVTTLELYQDLGHSLPEGIQVSDEDMPTPITSFWFETMTPRAQSRFNEDELVTKSPFWFQAIGPALESRSPAL